VVILNALRKHCGGCGVPLLFAELRRQEGPHYIRNIDSDHPRCITSFHAASTAINAEREGRSGR